MPILRLTYEERPASHSGGKKDKSLSMMVIPKLGSKVIVSRFGEPEAEILIDLKRLRERVANELERI